MKVQTLSDLSSMGDEVRVTFQAKREGRFLSLPPELFEPDPDQPRKHFNEQSLRDLMESMEQHGQLQPILVKPLEPGSVKYRIIAGERRWRAASMSARLRSLDAVIRINEHDDLLRHNLHHDLRTDEKSFPLSNKLVALLAQVAENKKRQDLSLLEEASTYRTVVNELGGSLEHASKVLRMSKSLLCKYLSLLQADQRVKSMVEQGICQDLATLYTVNNLLKVDPVEGDSMINNWSAFVAKGENMRRLSESKIRESKLRNKPTVSPLDPPVSDVSIAKETYNYLLRIRQGKRRQRFTLSARQFQMLRRQVLQY